MRTISLTLACLAILLLAGPAQSANDIIPPSTWQAEGPQMHAEEVMGLLVKGDNKEAFKLFFSRGRYPKNTLEKIQFDYFQLVKQQGPPSGYEKIFELKAGTHMTRLKYVLLFKSVPMVFDLYYFKTDKSWILKSFTLNKDIKKVFER